MRLCIFIVMFAVSSQVVAQAAPAQTEVVETEAEVAPPPASSRPIEHATTPRDAEIAAAEEQVMAAAAAAEAEPSRNRMGGSLGMEGMNELTGTRARGLGSSISFTYKSDEPFAVVGQFGVIAWPSAFLLGEAGEVPDKAPWEVFLAATMLPLTWGPVDFGFFVRLSAKRFFTTVADRAELGLAVQWQLDRTWALRYQVGASIITNILEPTLVSTLALDLAFPAFI